jgi:ribonuclease VapC
MFVDTSAIVEALLDGPQAGTIVTRLRTSSTPATTFPTVIYEAVAVLAGRFNAAVADVEQILRVSNINIISVDDQAATAALDAFARYGKGRHPAKLNFGDCFSYAGAKQAGVRLLYVGDDFAQTDLA